MSNGRFSCLVVLVSPMRHERIADWSKPKKAAVWRLLEADAANTETANRRWERGRFYVVVFFFGKWTVTFVTVSVYIWSGFIVLFCFYEDDLWPLTGWDAWNFIWQSRETWAWWDAGRSEKVEEEEWPRECRNTEARDSGKCEKEEMEKTDSKSTQP